MKGKKLYPAAITIFGAKGDLTHRKLIPAIYNLFIGNHLPSSFSLTCVDFLPDSDEEFRNYLLGGVNEFSRNGKADEKKWNEFSARICYIQGDFLKLDTFVSLRKKLDSFDKENKQR